LIVHTGRDGSGGAVPREQHRRTPAHRRGLASSRHWPCRDGQCGHRLPRPMPPARAGGMGVPHAGTPAAKAYRARGARASGTAGAQRRRADPAPDPANQSREGDRTRGPHSRESPLLTRGFLCWAAAPGFTPSRDAWSFTPAGTAAASIASGRRTRTTPKDSSTPPRTCLLTSPAVSRRPMRPPATATHAHRRGPGAWACRTPARPPESHTRPGAGETRSTAQRRKPLSTKGIRENVEHGRLLARLVGRCWSPARQCGAARRRARAPRAR